MQTEDAPTNPPIQPAPASSGGDSAAPSGAAEIAALKKALDDRAAEIENLKAVAGGASSLQSELAARDEVLRGILRERHAGLDKHLQEAVNIEELEKNPVNGIKTIGQLKTQYEELEKQILEKYGIKQASTDPTKRPPSGGEEKYDLNTRSGLLMHLAETKKGK
jgi:hypothetical protein